MRPMRSVPAASAKRGTRVMSTRRVLALLALVSLALALIAAGCGKHEEPQEWYCPMHPTYVSDRPGDCPICNMRLVPRAKRTSEEAKARPATEMERGESGAPGASTTDATGRKILYYRNPMDPTITSPVPAKDAMGMDFVPVYAGEVPTGPGGVPGYATVTLDTQSRNLAGVQTVAAARERLARNVRTVGIVRVDETRLQHVHVKVGGYAEKLHIASTGQLVRRGDPAIELYSPELIASQDEFLRALRAERELAGSSLPDARRGAGELLAAARRRLELYDVPPGFIDELEQSGVPQRTVTIPAHATGYVVFKNVVEGDRVDPGMELFTVADLSRVWVEAEFYENEAHLVRPGQTATLLLPYDPGRELVGKVAYIYPYVEPTSRTLKVRLEFANPNLLLKPSMYVDVLLQVEAPEGVVVPESAVLDTGERQIVFVELSGDRFEPRVVQTGLRSEGRVELMSGVREGEQVVVGANFLLDSESRLRGALQSVPQSGAGAKP